MSGWWLVASASLDLALKCWLVSQFIRLTRELRRVRLVALRAWSTGFDEGGAAMASSFARCLRQAAQHETGDKALVLQECASVAESVCVKSGEPVVVHGQGHA